MSQLKKVAVAAAAAGALVVPLMSTPAVAETAAAENSSFTSAQESHRLAGSDRYATAVEVSQHLYPLGAGTVFIASGTNFPDALAGGPAATHEGGPVLLVKQDQVPAVVAQELGRLSPDRVFVLGGGVAVSEGVVDALKAYGPVERLAGSNRQGTAAEIASLWSHADTVFVASGGSYPDALAGGAAAAHEDAPVLLAGRTSLSSQTTSRLAQLDPSTVVVLGGSAAVSGSAIGDITAAVPDAKVVRYHGQDRYATAQAVAANVWPEGSSEAFYATGAGFADALAGVPAAAHHAAPLLLVRAECAPATTRRATNTLGVVGEYLLGGTAAIANGATTTACDAQPAPDTVLAVLEDIPVKGRAPRTGYDRGKFGPAWTDDVDVQGGHNGCDTRNDILRRDLESLTVKPDTMGCVAQSGWLDDPFSGERLWFKRPGASKHIHIDHIVALSDAWQKGAQQLSVEQRKNFANDPLNLWAVDGSLNMSKGDSDAATWLPPNTSIRCDYVSYQVAVKDRYNLWMTTAEKQKIADIVTTSCPTKKIPTSHDVPAARR